MKRVKGVVALAFGLLATIAVYPVTVAAEPLLTLFQFAKATYDDRGKSEVVVKINRIDQDPAAKAVAFEVDCVVSGGDAMENRDYRFGGNGLVSSLGRITFPPGVSEQTFTIQTFKTAGPTKTLRLSLANPSGPAPAATGENSSATITLNNVR